jgi:sarcosine oxidase
LDGRGQQHRHVDVLVIGGGVVGAAAACAVARRGPRVVLLERSSLAVAHGSSAGGARIFAPAAYPDEAYLDMGLRALERWREIEQRSGEMLLRRTAALSRGQFAEREMPALQGAGVEAEFLSPGEAARRFGVVVPDETPLLCQPDAGVIRADRARNVLLRMARSAGAELHQGERVRSIAQRDDAVELETDAGRWRCSSAIVAAGPWSGDLLADAGIELPLAVSSQSVAYFSVGDRSIKPVVLMEFEGDEPYACWDPERGLKAALHARGPVVDPDEAPREVERQAIARVVDWVGARFPRVASEPAAVETCLYTNTPDERFILERRGRIVIASACNGHGFQFAPETGERLAQLALGSEERIGARM